jgi:molecular chaperone HscB
MPSPPDYFSLFQLPERFALDGDALDAAYLRVQTQVHPDRFAAGTGAEKRVAMQWAALANEALTTLKSPLRRAAYLCERNGVPIEAESNTAMPADFLIQQMRWREALDEASADLETLAELRNEVATAHAQLRVQLGEALDQRADYLAAAALVRRLMFVEKFADEVAAAGEALAA